jgi:hypothetical protein
MPKKAAYFISVIFHPSFLTLICVIIIFLHKHHLFFTIAIRAEFLMAMLITICTIIIPYLLLIIFKNKGYITDLKLSSQKERIYPLISAGILNILVFTLFSKTPLPWIFQNLFLANAVIPFFLLVLNFFTKTSIHTTGFGALIGFLIGISYRAQVNMVILLITGIIIAGIVGTARLSLDAHKPSEVYLGYLVGILTMTGIMIFC